MDINSLLSPAESPGDENPPSSISSRSSPAARQPPLRRHGRPPTQQRKSSGLSQQYSPSPRAQENSLPSLAAFNAAYQHQQAMYPPGSSNGKAPVHPSTTAPSTPTTQKTPDLRATPPHPPIQRHGSTPQMDTLADLASMQQHQHSSPQASVPLRDVKQTNYSLQNLPRPPLSARSSNEIVMTDPDTQEQRTYKTKALSEKECQSLNELGNHLITNPFDYPGHVKFVNLLSKGFATHISNGENPLDYELLIELRGARSAMEQIFPLGENLWASWLDDEVAMARNVEDRVRLSELFARAVSDEPSSVQLWRKYGDYAYSLWATAYNVDDPTTANQSWSVKDIELGKEYFKWGPMLRIWEDAVTSTHFRLNDSHLVWDRYIGVLIQDHEIWPNQQKIQNIEKKFAERLGEAHATWDDTYQNFGQFLSKHDPSNYENIMSQMSKNRGAQTAWRLRESFEMAIKKATESGDETAEYNTYMEYLDWELQKKGVFSFRLINSLYERATIRFPAVQSIWVDYIDFLIGDDSAREFPVMSVIERATRHCPWSGDLWAHRLLTMEATGQPFVEIEKIKHRATSTGLLDVGGMEELMKVYVAWCGGLRRRAFAVGASEDELDIAEVAIRSALEHVKKIGQDKYGMQFAGDPNYRLERIYIKFMTQKGEIDVARESWKELKKVQANYYDFWYRYYIWEMVIWAKFAMRSTNEPETQLRQPEMATALLKESLENINTMDWPEQLVPMYLNHCEHHELVPELRTAVIKARQLNRMIAKRREKEAADAQAALPQMEPIPEVAEQAQLNGKRKREEGGPADGTDAKKARSSQPEEQNVLPAAVEKPRRDREHTTILVENIPLKATEGHVSQYFRSCGAIKSMKLVDEGKTKVATIEFETQDEAAYSLMKSGKVFEGNELSVKFGTGCTIFMSNYPPEADKEYIQNLFKDCGEIVDIRLPSLTYNNKRRFAYVQFLDPDQATRATKLDGTKLEGKFELKVAISDPDKAKNRAGPQADGREVFVSNVYWYADEEELETLFESAGEVESVRIPRNVQGKSKGVAFVVFASKEAAEKSVEKFNDLEYKHRKLHVSISSSNKKTRVTTNIHRGSTMSPTPETNGARSTTGDVDTRDHKERTVALMNVPDTVTAARLEKLVEQYGQIKKFTLRPDHGGAIVEFQDVSSVGKVQMALEDYNLDDHRLRVGTVPELLKETNQIKDQSFTAAKSKKEEKKKTTTTTAQNLLPTIARPAQPGARLRKPGLGFTKRATAVVGASANEPSGPKGNEYFRTLMGGNAAAAAAAPKKDSQQTPVTVSGNGVEAMEKNEDNDDNGVLDDIMDAGNGDGQDADEGGLLDDIMGD